MEAHLDMVRVIAKMCVAKLPTSFEADDLFQVGVIGLMQAAERWDPERGTPFNLYAVRRVRGAMYDHVRRLEYTEQAHDSLDFCQSESDDGYQQITDDYTCPAVPSCAAAVEERLDRATRMRPGLAAVRNLKPAEQLVLGHHYYADRTLKSLTTRLRVSKCRVSQIHTSAIAALRADLEVAS